MIAEFWRDGVQLHPDRQTNGGAPA